MQGAAKIMRFSTAATPVLLMMMRRGFASSTSSRPPTTSRVSRSSRPARAVRPASFDPPAGDPAAFLAELKSFAARHPRQRAEDLSSLLPLSFSGDASLLLSGERRVVTSASEFDFACTGCGACCRSYPNDVMLDPHDIFLVSRAAAAGLGSTSDMHREYPRAFQSQLGIFESAPHLIEEKMQARSSATIGSAPLASLHKLAPVLFLRTKRVKQTSKQTGAVRVEERCWFSYSAEKTPVPMEADAEGEAVSASGEPVMARPPARKTPAGNNSTAGLRCRLGPAHQPTACALYPLGELYTSNNAGLGPAAAPASDATATSSSPAPASVAKYYSLDVTNCEGTRVRSSASTRTTVAGYEERNGLVGRRNEWEWFERELARPFAARGWLTLQPDSAALPASAAAALTPEFREQLTDVLFTVWYDFDSLECAPSVASGAATAKGATAASEPRFPDWPSARAAITTATQRITEATEAYVDECNRTAKADDAEEKRAEAETRWLARLREQGLFKREVSQ